MTLLVVYDEKTAAARHVLTDRGEIRAALGEIDITYEVWEASHPITQTSTQDEILNAYQQDVTRLKREGGYQAVDVINVHSGIPDVDKIRAKFLAEHVHSEDEVRFFIDGRGVFYIHVNEAVYAAHLTKGDLINLPAGTKHWFDMGLAPFVKCIRLFTNPSGWVAQYTEDKIAERFPQLPAIEKLYGVSG